ncbi:MAG: glycosyltransferase family 4 protein, partial [Anaerolineales bacterium]|nr:glycosyltransferase family 4 protein [Anaerolineales bacterium]
MLPDKTHILVLTPAYPPFHGGGERYTQSLLQALAQANPRLRFTVLTSTAVAEQDFWHGRADPNTQTPTPQLTIQRHALRPAWGGRNGLFAWRKLMVVGSQLSAPPALLRRMAGWVPRLPLSTAVDKLAQQDPFDLIHGFNISWEAPLVAGWQAAQAHATPFVVTPYAHLGQRHGDKVARNSTMRHQLAILREAQAVLTLTDIEKEGLGAYGVPLAQIHTIGGGGDPLPATMPPLDWAALGLTRPFVLFIGRVSFDKGALHALEAILHLNEADPPTPVQLALVGALSPEFERRYQRLSDQQKAWIRPLGRVDEGVKHALLREAAMLVLPSHTDSFGIVFLEAWAHATAVVGARAGGIPGVVTDGEDGLLVPFGDVPALSAAIQRLLADQPLRVQLGRAGQEKLQTQFN